MKFKGKPNLLVTIARSNPTRRFKFNSKGILEIDDSEKNIIKRFKAHFEEIKEVKKDTNFTSETKKKTTTKRASK